MNDEFNQLTTKFTNDIIETLASYSTLDALLVAIGDGAQPARRSGPINRLDKPKRAKSIVVKSKRAKSIVVKSKRAKSIVVNRWDVRDARCERTLAAIHTGTYTSFEIRKRSKMNGSSHKIAMQALLAAGKIVKQADGRFGTV